MQDHDELPRLGAWLYEDGARFRVWAPGAHKVELICDGQPHSTSAAGDGYFSASVPGGAAGSRYGYRVDGGPLWPDPASRFQPDGVHELSEVIDPSRYRWRDESWKGVSQRDLTIYELHVGTFTPEGTFDGVRSKLPFLRDLGITAIELMPLADFPGRWGWGYDPAAFWAPSRAYGRPDDLRALVDAAHELGLAVILDVVYNHLGPDGAYVACFAPMFKKGHTPWGQAINLDGRHSAGVRSFMLGNALYWLDEMHFDGLRLDATFALYDDSPSHFLAELAHRARALPGPERCLIVEDPRHCDWVIRPSEDGGYGLNGVWADDFHHIMYRCLTGHDHGPYRGFPATTAALAQCIQDGWYVPEPELRAQGHKLGHEYLVGHVPQEIYDEIKGTASGLHGLLPATAGAGLHSEQFVFYIQNHDQVSNNRARGERLHQVFGLPVYRALSAAVLFAPAVPLLFMGQEWAASTPFTFFCDHHEELGKMVRAGREREHASVPGFKGHMPDPQAADTFESCKLDWQEQSDGHHRGILALYRDLLARRQELAGDARASSPIEGSLVIERGEHILAVAIEPGITLDLRPYGNGTSELLWHSEEPAYTDDPRPPRLHRTGDGLTLELESPAAVLLSR